MRRALLTTLLPAAIALAVASTIAQEPSRTSQRDFDTWLDAVEHHAAGERDAALERVAAWPSSTLDGLLPTLSRQPNMVEVVERAILLHMDVAVLNRRERGYALPAGTTRMTLYEDGRAVGQTAGTYQWEFARRLINRLPPGERRQRIATAFYRTAGAVLQLWGEHPEFDAHLAAGRRVIGQDAVLLLYEGTQQQTYAGARAQRFFQERRRARPDWRPTASLAGNGPPSRETSSPPEALPSVNDARGRAEQLFRRALTLDAALAEARIRLAHVLADRGKHDEATVELTRATTTQLPPFLEYYAALLGGRDARRRGNLDAARDAFERAALMYPNAQAPRLALSELASAEGEQADSLARLTGSAGPRASPSATDDPWWWIERVHAPSAEALLEQIRHELGR